MDQGDDQFSVLQYEASPIVASTVDETTFATVTITDTQVFLDKQEGWLTK